MPFDTSVFVFVQIESTGDMEQISITDVLLEIRQYRVGLIQTPDQLRFTYLAILEGVKVLMPEIYQKATENHWKANEGRLSVSDNLTWGLVQKQCQSNVGLVLWFTVFRKILLHGASSFSPLLK